MSLGQASRPLEGKDDTKVTVRPAGNDSVIMVLDPEARATLERIATAAEEVRDLLRLIVAAK